MPQYAPTVQDTESNGHRATDRIQRTLCNGQHAMQRTACNGQHATDNVQRAVPAECLLDEQHVVGNVRGEGVLKVVLCKRALRCNMLAGVPLRATHTVACNVQQKACNVQQCNKCKMQQCSPYGESGDQRPPSVAHR